MLEKMSDFFERRLDGYDEHMLTEIESAREFYPFTAEQLPRDAHCRILDLGCGTGLELEYFFRLNPSAQVTGIDLSPAMLDALRSKFPDKDITLIQGSYFDVPLGGNVYDAAVSVESLHHFTQAEKTALYARLHAALKDGGYLILTDYFAPSEAEETLYRTQLTAMKAAQGIAEDELCHYDTPLTVAHEVQALTDAGFASVEEMGQWGATHTLKACK